MSADPNQTSVWHANLRPSCLGSGWVTGLRKCVQELSAQAAVMGNGAMIGSSSVSHVAHLAGAVAGVLLVFALTRLPEVADV